MAITRHQHVNENGFVHLFEVDSDAGTVSIVKPDGLLQPSSTNIEPILALPLADATAEAAAPEAEMAAAPEGGAGGGGAGEPAADAEPVEDPKAKARAKKGAE